MARRAHEQSVIDRFTAHLAEVSGRIWKSSPDEVPTGKNVRYYDCEFTSPGSTPIAADICRLFPAGSCPQELAKRAEFNKRLLSALTNLGVGGLVIETPPVQKKHAHHGWHRTTAERIREGLARQPLSAEAANVEVDGCTVERIAGDADASWCYHSQFSAVQPIDGAGRPLAILLNSKNEQLDVDGHERYLIAVNDGSRARAVDVRDACAFINFHQYPNFDRIYFEESEARFHLIFDRKAWHSLEAGALPEDDEGRRLVVSWIEVRLSGRWSGALETALQVCCERHSTDWLTESGRKLLEVEAHRFLQCCEWETPRSFWEMFRGPVPHVIDLRWKAAPIGEPLP